MGVRRYQVQSYEGVEGYVLYSKRGKVRVRTYLQMPREPLELLEELPVHRHLKHAVACEHVMWLDTP